MGHVMAYLLAQNTASITEFKTNPMQVMAEAEGAPVVVLNRNQPAFYCVTPEHYERMMDMLEDIELAKIVRQREGQKAIPITLEKLKNL